MRNNYGKVADGGYSREIVRVAAQPIPARETGHELSEKERKLGLAGRRILRAYPRLNGYSGETLRKMRKINGVGRPPKGKKL